MTQLYIARFKKPGSKNYQNIYPPSSTLHLSNIPATVEEEDLREAFNTININVQVGGTQEKNFRREAISEDY